MLAPKTRLIGVRDHRFQIYRVSFIGLLVILSSLLLSGCYKSPIIVTAKISPKPIVGEYVTLHIELFADYEDLPNTTLTVYIPDGIDIVYGDTTWQGDIPQGKTIPINLTIKIREPGEWRIYANAFSDFGNGGFGDGTELYISSTFNSAKVIIDPTATAPPVIQTVDRNAITIIPLTSTP